MSLLVPRLVVATAVSLLAGLAQAQTQPQAQPSAFCQGVNRAVTQLPRASSAYPAPTQRPVLSGERGSPIPGFTSAYLDTSEDTFSARMYGPRAFQPDAQFQIMNDLLQGIVGCYPGITPRVTPSTAPRYDRKVRAGFDIEIAPGRESFYLKAHDDGAIILSIYVWRPGRWAVRQREIERHNARYTSVGCTVGDDVCLTRKAVGR